MSSSNEHLEDVKNQCCEMVNNFKYLVYHLKPQDIVQFASEYFSEMNNTSQRPESTRVMKQLLGITNHSDLFENENNKTKTNFAEDNSDNAAPSQIEYKTPKRRGSVAAPKLNLADIEDDDSDDVRIIPKTDKQRKNLRKICQSILIFKALEDEELSRVIDAMSLKQVNPGNKIIVEGEAGDNFYIIESGVFDVLVKDPQSKEQKKVYTYQNSGSFGELSLMYNAPRSATIVSRTNGTLWALDQTTFRKLVLIKAMKRRKMYESLIKSVGIFQQMSNYEQNNIADALIMSNFKLGEYVITEGEIGEKIYFVFEGTLDVMIKNNGEEEKLVKKLIKGDYFGELALLTNKPRAASVKVTSNEAKIASLDRESFERLLGPCVDIMKRNVSDYKKQMKNFGKL